MNAHAAKKLFAVIKLSQVICKPEWSEVKKNPPRDARRTIAIACNS